MAIASNHLLDGRPRLPCNRIALILQVAFGLYLAVMHLHGGIEAWYTRGGGRPKPSIYGIWDVEQMTIDGQIRSPLLTDYDRWRRVIFDFTTSTSFQRMDESFASFGSSINDKSKTLTLAKDDRSEEHTSELQSRLHLVCRLLLEKKKSRRRPSP